MFIPDPDLDFLPIPDPGSRGQKGTGSRIRIRNNATNFAVFLILCEYTLTSRECYGSRDSGLFVGYSVRGTNCIKNAFSVCQGSCCGGLHLVINIYFMSYVCLANYGASEAVYPCVVVEKIHESF
jgi:hypothetical protein